MTRSPKNTSLPDDLIARVETARARLDPRETFARFCERALTERLARLEGDHEYRELLAEVEDLRRRLGLVERAVR